MAEAKAKAKDECRIKGCDKEVRARGLCINCYANWAAYYHPKGMSFDAFILFRTEKLRKKKAPKAKCSVEGCSSVESIEGLCNKCYVAWYRYKHKHKHKHKREGNTFDQYMKWRVDFLRKKRDKEKACIVEGCNRPRTSLQELCYECDATWRKWHKGRRSRESFLSFRSDNLIKMRWRPIGDM